MIQRNLLIFTRTPLHVGAVSSVGAIDQPIQRERHTGFPIIPGSSLKGCFADQWRLLSSSVI
jgi:CRISPR-associated protein Cmr4